MKFPVFGNAWFLGPMSYMSSAVDSIISLYIPRYASHILREYNKESPKISFVLIRYFSTDFFYPFLQDVTLSQGPQRDAPNIWVPWK